MPQDLFPFLHQVPDGERQTQGVLDGLAKEYHDQDWEDVQGMVDYRRNCGWEKKAIRGMKVYNVLQTMKPDDEVSRIFLGYSRTSIDQGINQMTEGEPDFSFEPFGPSDHLKTIVWKHLIKMVLSQSKYKLHQQTFFRDYFVMGCGVFEVFIDYPQRTIRIPNSQTDGGFENVVIQDYRRPKVGIRAINPMHCWRNTNIDSPNDVPSCLKRRIITWNQFAQEFGRCKDSEGKHKYTNLEKIAKGTHICLYYYQDEIRDIYRIYATSFGNESDGFARTYPPIQNLGVCIFDQPLKIHDMVVNKQIERSTGLNIPGVCSLRWGINFDKYDNNFQGDHSVYGMGLPERIEAEDTAIQGIFNQNLDNFRWTSTVVLNYEGSHADSYLDVDANRLYGAELIDGKITPMPLGITRIGDYQAMMEQMDKSVIPATGVNHNQLVGDTSKTLGEFALRIRQANRNAEQRLTRLETEVFQPVGSLLLANSLTVLTEDDYEAMTEEQVENARQMIKEGKKPLSDYRNLNGDKPEKRYTRYIPIKGEKLREDFTITKKRQLDYNASFDEKGRTRNTLVFDKDMNVENSYIPLVKEYVYPAEYIESGLLPDCIVDSKRMLADIKNQDVNNVKVAVQFILDVATKLGYQGADWDKIVGEMLQFADIDPKRVLKTQEENKTVAKLDELLTKMEENQTATSPEPQFTSTMPQVTDSQVEAPTLEQGDPAANAMKTATGVI